MAAFFSPIPGFVFCITFTSNSIDRSTSVAPYHNTMGDWRLRSFGGWRLMTCLTPAMCRSYRSCRCYNLSRNCRQWESCFRSHPWKYRQNWIRPSQSGYYNAGIKPLRQSGLSGAIIQILICIWDKRIHIKALLSPLITILNTQLYKVNARSSSLTDIFQGCILKQERISVR